jgi:dihydropteroate synthase type 2
VQRHCLERNVAFINDIAGFDDASLYPELARSECRLVIMHSIQRGKATRAADSSGSMPTAIARFLDARADALVAAGVKRERIIVDPGMGFFLADTPEPSFEMLAAIDQLRSALELPILVSVSRKSFLGAVTGRAVTERGAATLAAELYAAGAGVDYIRTHDVAALTDGLVVLRSLAAADLRRDGGTDI